MGNSVAAYCVNTVVVLIVTYSDLFTVIAIVHIS